MKNQVLVTGGTGYIGSHTVVELINAGYDVVIADNLSNSRIEVLDGIKKITGIKPPFEQINVCNKDKLHNLLNKYPNINSVIHFAAYKAVGESVENPLKYYENNIGSLVNVLTSMKEYNIKYIVFSSSCTVYGQPDKLPVDENTPVKKANSPYGNTKQICEDIIADTLNADNDMQSISLRYFNPIGAHESAFIGELPTGVPDNLIPYVTQTAIGIREQLKVYGDDYNTPDGSCIRDYINVVDLARAHVIAINRLINKANKQNYEIFNLGTGKGNSVLEIVRTFEKVTQKKLNYKIVGRRKGDIEKIWADTKLANKELGWKAEKSLEQTLLSAWKWQQYINK